MPCPVLLVRSVDRGTTEETVSSKVQRITHGLIAPGQIFNALNGIAPVKEVRLVQDVASKSSRGFAFVELATLEVRLSDASLLYQHS